MAVLAVPRPGRGLPAPALALQRPCLCPGQLRHIEGPPGRLGPRPLRAPGAPRWSTGSLGQSRPSPSRPAAPLLPSQESGFPTALSPPALLAALWGHHLSHSQLLPVPPVPPASAAPRPPPWVQCHLAGVRIPQPPAQPGPGERKEGENQEFAAAKLQGRAPPCEGGQGRAHTLSYTLAMHILFVFVCLFGAGIEPRGARHQATPPGPFNSF